MEKKLTNPKSEKTDDAKALDWMASLKTTLDGALSGTQSLETLTQNVEAER